MLKLKKVLTLVLSTLLLSSCGLFKGSSRVKTEDRVTDIVTEGRVDKVSTEVSSGEVSVNKDVNTKVTEQITKTTTSGTNTRVEVKKEDLKGGKAELTDSFGRKVILSLDSLRESLTIEIESPTVTQEVTTRTTEQTDRSNESGRQSSTKNNSEAVTIRTEDRSTVTTSDTKDSRSNFWDILAMWVGGSLMIVILGLSIYKFILKK